MSQNIVIKHPLEKQILDRLASLPKARFIELRPAGIETNSLAYHLKRLLYLGLIIKKDEFYRLSRRGRNIVNPPEAAGTAGGGFRVRVSFVVQNGDGDILMRKVGGGFGLPGSLLPPGEASLLRFAASYVDRDMGLKLEPRYVGHAYVRQPNRTAAELVHVFKFDSDDVLLGDQLVWARPHKIESHQLEPGTAAIMARAFFSDPFFFEEFEEPTSS